MKAMRLGEPVFFRLKAPRNAIAGYGFFGAFSLLELRMAWQTFGDKNGDPDIVSFLTRIGNYRGVDLIASAHPSHPLAALFCATRVFWPGSGGFPGAKSKAGANIVRARRRGMLQVLVCCSPKSNSNQMRAPGISTIPSASWKWTSERCCWGNGQIAWDKAHQDPPARRLRSEVCCDVREDGARAPSRHVQPYLGPRSTPAEWILMAQARSHALRCGTGHDQAEYQIRISSRIRGALVKLPSIYECDGKQ